MVRRRLSLLFPRTERQDSANSWNPHWCPYNQCGMLATTKVRTAVANIVFQHNTVFSNHPSWANTSILTFHTPPLPKTDIYPLFFLNDDGMQYHLLTRGLGKPDRHTSIPVTSRCLAKLGIGWSPNTDSQTVSVGRNFVCQRCENEKMNHEKRNQK